MDNKITNLRNLLYHLKSDWLKEHNPEKYKKEIEYCKENLYDSIQDNINYFKDEFYSNLCEIHYCIPISLLSTKKPREICELYEIFNNSATGLYGLKYDNQTEIVITDIFGNPYKLQAFSPKNYLVKSFQFVVYNMNGIGCIYKFNEPLNAIRFNPKHIAELNKIYKRQEVYYAKELKEKNRYEELLKYKDYIQVKNVGFGYAHSIKDVSVKKDIPIKIDMEEIAKYADEWNYCFGGEIDKINEDEKWVQYRVKIYTD